MKTILKIVGGLVALVLLTGGGAFLYAKSKLNETLARTLETHTVDFPVPFPLSEEELAALRAERAEATGEAEAEAPDPLAGVDLQALALERAVARGAHLLEARYACRECHGSDLGGGVMIDAAPMGTWRGPNLTSGKGSKVEGYTVNDWDRIVRHGITPAGHPAIMPAEDFERMTDRELSDIIAYIQSVPPVDAEVPAPTYGPVSTMLVAFGAITLAADRLEDHQAPHPESPPAAEPTAEFGQHLANVCTGCHRAGLEGGKILNGDPSWPPAMNLTPHEEGLAGWTYEQFVAALRDGVRPDGTALRAPMDLIPKYMVNTTDTEMRALWAYVQGVEARPTPR